MEDFTKTYDKYKNDVYRLALSYTKNIADSEDITQNVFIKYFKNKEFVSDNKIKNWLIKVTINECKNILLSSWKKRIISICGKEENIKLKEKEDQYIIDSIFKLQKKDRVLVYLYYYENYSVKDISELLNISVSNVKVRLHRSRNLLKDILEEEKSEK